MNAENDDVGDNCDLRVINTRKRHFLSYRTGRRDAQTETWHLCVLGCHSVVRARGGWMMETGQ